MVHAGRLHPSATFGTLLPWAFALACAGCGSPSRAHGSIDGAAIDGSAIDDGDMDAMASAGDGANGGRDGAVVDGQADGATAAEDGSAADGDGSTVDAGPAVGFGTVSLYSNSFMSGSSTFQSYAVAAAFGLRNTDASTCTLAMISGCAVHRCAPPPLGDGGMVGLPIHAGPIGVRGGREEVLLLPAADGQYPAATSSRATLWSGGEELEITAVGSLRVPSFTQLLEAPGPMRVSAPALPTFGEAFALPRSRPLTLSWETPTTARTLTVTLAAILPTGGSVVARCDFDASLGSGTVAAGVLAELPAGEGSMSLQPTAQALLRAGEYEVRVIATTLAVRSDGVGVSTLLDLR